MQLVCLAGTKVIEMRQFRGKINYVRVISNSSISLIPLLITLWLIKFYLRVDFSDFTPIYFDIYNDTILYWRQIYTFQAVGFDGGYYSGNEHVAANPLFHFYTWGPWYPTLYGSLGKIFGWHTYSGVIFNLLLSSVFLFYYLWRMKFNRTQSFLLGIMVATFWSLLFYLPSNMQETIHYAIATGFALIFFRLLDEREQVCKLELVCGFVFIVIASQFRATWAVLLFPFFLLIWPYRLCRALFLLLTALVLFFILFGVYSYNGAPYPYFFSNWASGLNEKPFSDSIMELLRYTYFNVRLLLFDEGENLNTLESLLFFQFELLLGFFIIWVILRKFPDFLKKPLQRIRYYMIEYTWDEVLLHLVNLGIIFAIMITLYALTWSRSYRILAAHLFFSALLLLSRRRYWLVTFLIVTNLVITFGFLKLYEDTWGPQFHYDTTQIVEFKNIDEDVVMYDPATKNPWCNTLLFPFKEWRKEMRWVNPPELYMGLHPGIGISHGMPTLQSKSRYFFLDEEDFNSISSEVDVELLAVTLNGDIYLNRRADCPGLK